MRLFLNTFLIAMTTVVSAGAAQVNNEPRGGVFAPGGHNTDQPIEITSDTLEVEQDKQVAVFIGNVDAIQGDLRLNSDRLEVYYVVEEENAAPRSTAEQETQSDSIKSLRAEGNVVVTSPKETAKGDWADYDVSKRILTLHENVVLTQGRNVLCGSSLDMNLNTGRSQLNGRCASSASNPNGRVQGVFYPSKSND